MRLLGTLLLVFVIHMACAQEHTMVFLNTNPDRADIGKEVVDSLQRGHLANIQRLAKEGKLTVAGPFVGGGGLFILNTGSITEANEWLATDPAISNNRFKIEVYPWTVRIGNICLVDETAEFIQYNFVRFDSHITKFNVREAPRHMSNHDLYVNELVKTGNVLNAGTFANTDGATLVMKGDLDPDVIDQDPAVKTGFLEPTIKKIWVGKGSFCED